MVTGLLHRTEMASWLVASIVGALAFLMAAASAIAIHHAYDHQVRMQDEAESVHGRFKQWLDWLPRNESNIQESRSSTTVGSDLPLSPQSLIEIARISDRVRSEALRLQHERAEANAVLANLDGGVIALDPQTRITLINAAAKKFFQIDRPCLGQPLIQSIRQPEIIETVQRVMRDRSSREVHVEVRNDEGQRRSLRIRCSSLRYGDVAGVLLAAHDESETKHSEEVRREFVANVSHELKTPLAAIKGYAETVELALNDDPEAAKHFVSQIHDQCKRLERLIADMMTLARAQAGIQHLRPTTVDLNEVIAESIATYAPVAAARQIALKHVWHDQQTTIHADREATLTIANNVIGNAIRYTPEGGAVNASARSEGDFGVLSVQDNGIGIPENEQKRIFERFYRVDRSRKHASSGTGLGLSIVKNLTQSQGGEIKLRSRQGEGSTFEIFLPAHPAPEIDLTQPS
jgi:two-component system, OmpR family, phosphate regulon sensor histidine kinase PhoR